MRDSLYYFRRLKEVFEPKVKEFLEDHFFREKLLHLKEAISKTKKAYIETGSFHFCGECARRGIRCCGEGLEWKLSPEEFFLNLCLFYEEGSDFTLTERAKEDCLFLGERGCTLILVPLFCRNFFCSELSAFLGREKLKLLGAIYEEEANLTFRLCEELKTRLKISL